MRATWKGYITIGQLGIPVRLYSASSPSAPSFKLIHERDGSPVDRVLKCRAEGKEINYSETIRAYEYEPGRYVTFSGGELERATAPQVRAIDVKQFGNLEDIDPAYYEKPYYIVPARGGEMAYALLREALRRTNKIAIAQFVIYNREHIASVYIRGDMLMLNQLRFTAELVPRSSIKTPALPKPPPTEIDTLTQLIDRYSGALFIEDYHDDYIERLNELVNRKIKGLPIPRTESVMPHTTPQDELLTTLRRSLNPTKQDKKILSKPKE